MDSMKIFTRAYLIFCVALGEACSVDPRDVTMKGEEAEFQYQTEQFADIRILRYQVPGFENLSLARKRLLYYLSQAAFSGRDIIWDQNYRHNLYVRRTLENIVETYAGERSGPEWDQFLVYTKRVWFSNGIHHHYSTLKIMPEFSREYFAELVRDSDEEVFPSQEGETVEDLIRKLIPIVFDPSLDGKRINLDPTTDQTRDSATNYYAEELTQKEVEAYYASIIDTKDPRPISYGLNSKLVKEDGRLREKTWKLGGMYTEAIEKIIFWLEKALSVAETPKQGASLEQLIEYYQTGDLKKFDLYSMLWVQDTRSSVDVINGFIEVYGDPLGYKGAFESVVSFRDMEATRRMETLSRHTQWFEDHSPILTRHKKEKVIGISAKVITVVAESGDASPSTPIGINLPNANWIRKEHGSKSVNLGNIVTAYHEADKSSGILEEFAYDHREIELGRAHGTLASNLHTDLHEVIGHASGQIESGIGTPKETLRSYASTLEEARADLVALYYLLDQKLVEIGVMPSLEVGKARYQSYIRNGLLIQLARLKPGENLEQAHMRNRQMICRWVYEKGTGDNIIERKMKEGATYFVINDYEGLRKLFGKLLREVQWIKSKGDYEAGKKLVEEFGVSVDRDLHSEVRDRYAKLRRAPYSGFINPRLVPITSGQGDIVDVRIEYPKDFTAQMMEYAQHYSFLPTYN